MRNEKKTQDTVANPHAHHIDSFGASTQYSSRAYVRIAITVVKNASDVASTDRMRSSSLDRCCALAMRPIPTRAAPAVAPVLPEGPLARRVLHSTNDVAARNEDEAAHERGKRGGTAERDEIAAAQQRREHGGGSQRHGEPVVYGE
jgi:hypothetical protein